MDPTLALFALLLSYLTVIRPLYGARAIRKSREDARRYREFQLMCVKLYHPGAAGLSGEEIRTGFNITASYHDLGNTRLSRRYE